MPPAAAMPQAADSIVPIVVETAQTTTLETLVSRLRDERLVYVGETHTSLSDHRLQLYLLRAMAAQGQPLALGVEWFQRPYQDVLDDYIAGRIDEANLLRKTEYFRRWGFDYRLYRDILRFAREQRIPVVALNARRELTDAVMKNGLDGLDAEQRGQLPIDYDFDDDGYASLLRDVFGRHDERDQEDNGMFQRFLEVQLTWDETMAQTVADYLSGHPDSRMLVLAGKGHTHPAAIPNRVQRRTGVAGVSVGSFQAGAPFNRADFLVLQTERELPPQGVIGVALEERQGGLYVSAFSPGSQAEQAGIQVGDRLLAIGEAAVSDYTDVKLLMMNREPGQTLSVLLLRDSLIGGERPVRVDVSLIPAMGLH